MEPRRVLRVITRLNIGGPARQALLLTRRLAPEYITDLVVGTPDSGEGELSDPDVHVTRAPLARSVALRRDLHAYRFLRDRIATGHFDIAHTHMAKAGTLVRETALRSDRVPRLVHTFHGHVLDGYFSRPVQRLFTQIERRLARRTDALVAVSEEVRDELLDLEIGSEERWHVIPLGFDLEPMLAIQGPSGVLRERLDLKDAPLIGVLGRLAPIKDHATLIHAVARLKGVHLAILGDGELRQEVEGLIAALGVTDRVHLVGWMLDVPAAIADMDLVVLTSRNEGTPVSLIEAHACGRAVVATDVGGVRSVVLDELSGLLVPPGDVRALVSAVGRLLADPILARRMGERGREHVRVRFAADRLVSDICALYEGLLR